MREKLTLAALVLAVGLSAAGCGTGANAGASARGWNREAEDRTIQYQNESRGPLTGGYYSAGEDGRVAGFDQDRDPGAQAGRDLRNAGRDLVRGAKDAELKGFDRQCAKVRLCFTDLRRTHTAELKIAERRSASLNGVSLPSAAGLIGKFRAVVFSPAFLSIVQNGPAERRRFIDAAVCQLKPAYAQKLADYSRLLRQIQPHEERFSPMDWLRGHSLTRRWQEIHLDVLDFANSLSFGLLMAIAGLCIFLIYIIAH